MCMSSSLNLSLQKHGAVSGDPDSWIAAKLWIPGQARNNTFIECTDGILHPDQVRDCLE